VYGSINVRKYRRGNQNTQSRETGNIGYTRQRQSRETGNIGYTRQRQSRETGNIGYTRQRQIKQIKQKHNMIVLDTTIQKKSYTYFIWKLYEMLMNGFVRIIKIFFSFLCSKHVYDFINNLLFHDYLYQ
jgi:hypothetical protein